MPARFQVKLEDLVTIDPERPDALPSHPATAIAQAIGELERSRKTIRKLVKWIRAWDDLGDEFVRWEIKQEHARGRLREASIQETVQRLESVFAPAIETDKRITAGKEAANAARA